MRSYAAPYRPQFAIGLGAGLLRQIFTRIPELVVGVAFDAVFLGTATYDLPLVPETRIPDAQIGQFWFTFGILLGTYLLGVLFQVTSQLSMGWASQRMLHDLRTDAYDAMQRQSLSYFEETETGQLVTILNNDVGNLQSFLGVLQGVIQFPISVAVAFGFMALLNWQLALALLWAPAIVIAVSVWYQRRIEPIYEDLRDRIGSLNARFENNLSGIATIKSYTAEDTEMDRVRDVADRRRQTELEEQVYSAFTAPFTTFVEQLAVLFLVVFGGYWVLSGPPGFFTASLTPGVVLTFVLYARSFVEPLRQIPSIVDSYESAKASAKRVSTLSEGSRSIDEPDDPVEVRHLDGRVTYEDVTFSYEESEPVIRDVSFSAEPGELIGVVGQTGAGKSTLVKLLFRFFDVDEGSIAVDGVDVREMSRRSLRTNLGYVEQEPFLFYGTVRENITYAVAAASDDEVRAAARRAGAHEFITDLPEGYDTEVGERGVKLSGGQRQRVAIARAIVSDPAVLVLDEATSHVDNETEAVIKRHLGELIEDRTAFVVAHRLSTVRDADTILVMDDGEIVERGTHEELLERDGVYATLWRIQVGETADLPASFVGDIQDRRGER